MSSLTIEKQRKMIKTTEKSEKKEILKKKMLEKKRDITQLIKFRRE